MTQTYKNLQRRQPAFSGRVWGILILLASLLLPSRSEAQATRVENFSSSSIGGKTEGGSFVLWSSAGEAAPVGETRSASFSILSGWIATVPEDNAALVVRHTPPDVQRLNEEVHIEVAVDNMDLVRHASLLYRQGGEAAFEEVDMTGVGGLLTGAIPAAATRSKGVAYYLSIEDRSGRNRRLPATGMYSVRVAVPEPGILMEETLPHGSETSAYRIFSVPLDLENDDAASVLVDDLGPYDDTRWRFFELLFDQTLAEFPETASMIPGKGYWLISGDEPRGIDSGAGTTVDLSSAYSIQLHPGWNFVGTPFNFPVPLENVRMESGQPFLLRSFSGHWNDPINDPVEDLRPFSGYAVFNSLQIVDEMHVGPEAAAAKRSGGVDFAGGRSWGIRIIARSGGARDVDNIAAVAEGARIGADPEDQPEPPVVGRFVSVYFPHPEWGMPVDRYSADVRSEGMRGYVWDLEVRGNVTDPVDLRFEGLEQVPAIFDIWMMDGLLRQTQDLRASNTYKLSSPTADEPRRLQLLVGEADFVKENLEAAHAISGAYELLPSFPNPFHAGTTIRYVLDIPSTVNVKVYDVLGREVAVLAENASRGAGHHSVVWDGFGSSGMPLQSGLYYVRLNASGRILTTAVVKMK